MAGWHHQLNRHEFEQTPGDSEAKGNLACCSPWGCRELDMTEQLSTAQHTHYTSVHHWKTPGEDNLQEGILYLLVHGTDWN